MVSVGRRHEFRGQGGALAEKELLHLLDQELLRLRGPGLETVLVEQHLLPVHPLGPGRLGDVLEDLLTELRVEGRFVQALHLLLVANAKYHVCHDGRPQTPLYWMECNPAAGLAARVSPKENARLLDWIGQWRSTQATQDRC